MSQQVTTVTRPGFNIPDYELLRPIGHGSYGEVWLARNVTGSWVALKIVHRSAFDHDRPFEREFEGIQRFEPVSRTDPSQVAILHVGRGDGFFYYVMELADDIAAEVTRLNSKSEIRNPKSEVDQSLLTSAATYQPKTLKRLLNDRGALPAQECLAIALALTRALAHLHRNGLVHRDVKPSNVIFVNGQAKLADIGLVTSVDATRSFVGTEGYLPPEGAGTPQADLYSLGKVLYEVSTGCDRKEFPELPADVATRPDRDALAELNAIVVRTCQFAPQLRYTSANALLNDFELLRCGQSIRRRRTWAWRFSLVGKVALAASLVVVLIAMLLVSNSERRFNALAGRSSVTTFENSGTKNREAYNAYTMGRFYWSKRTAEGLSNAIVLFENATRLDPNFARAYAGLADSYNLLDTYAGVSPDEIRPKAHGAVTRALELNPKLAEVQTSLAKFKLAQERDWDGAAQAFQKALELDPNYAVAHHWYADYLATMGRCEEAVRECQRAVELQPTSLIFNNTLGLYLLFARDYDGAIEQLRRTLHMDQYYAETHARLGWAYFHVGQNDKAIEELEKFFEIRGTNPTKAAERRAAYQAGGMEAYWRKRIEQMKADFAGKSLPSLLMARYSIIAGEVGEAFSWLEQACHEGRDDVKYLNVDPIYDNLRPDPRFHQLLRRMNLAERRAN